MTAPTASRRRAIGPEARGMPALSLCSQCGVAPRPVPGVRKIGVAARPRLWLSCSLRLAPILGRDRLSGEALDVAQPPALLGIAQRDGGAHSTGARSAADAMDI